MKWYKNAQKLYKSTHWHPFPWYGSREISAQESNGLKTYFHFESDTSFIPKSGSSLYKNNLFIFYLASEFTPYHLARVHNFLIFFKKGAWGSKTDGIVLT